MPLLTTRTKIVPSVADPREIVEGDPGNDDEKDKDPVKGSDKNTRFSHTLHPFHRSNKGQSDGDNRPLRVLGDTATEPEEEAKTKPEKAKTKPEEKVEGDVGAKPDPPTKAPETPGRKEDSAQAPKQSAVAEDPFSPTPSTQVGRSAMMPREDPEMVEVPVYQPITLPDGSTALIPMGTAKVPSARPTPAPSSGSSSAPGNSKGKAAATSPSAEKDDTPDKAAGGADKTKKAPSGLAPLHDLHNIPTEKSSDKPGSSKDHATPEEITEANLPKDHASSAKEPSGSSKPPAGASKTPTEGSKPGPGKSDDSAAKPAAGNSADAASKPPPVPKPPRSLPSLPTEPSGTNTVPPEREKEPWEIASPAATMPPVNVTPAPSVNKIKRKPVAKEDDGEPQTLGDKPTDEASPADKTPGSGSAGEKNSASKDKPLPPACPSGPAGGKPESDKPKPHREPPPPPGATPPAADPPGHVYCHCERCCTNPPRAGYHDMATSAAASPKPQPPKELVSKDLSAKEAGAKAPAKEPASKASEAKDAAGKDASAKDTAAKDPAPPKTPSPPPHVPLSHQTAPVHPDHPSFSPVPFPDITGPYGNVPLPKPSPPPGEDASKKKKPGKESSKEKDPKESGKEAEAEASAVEDTATNKPGSKETAGSKLSKAGSKKSNQPDGSKDKAGKDNSDDVASSEETLAGPSKLAAPGKGKAAQTEKDDEKQLAADRHKEVMDKITSVEKSLESVVKDNKEWRTENAEVNKKLLELGAKLLSNDEELKKAIEAESKKPGVQAVLDALKSTNEAQASYFRKLCTDVMDQNSSQHKLTQDAAKLWAREQVTFNLSNYLDNFSRVLAGETRQLVREVQTMADLKRALLLEMSDLMLQKARMSGSEVLAVIPYPAVPGKGPAPPKKDEKKDGKPKEDGKKPPGIPPWAAHIPPGAPMMGMPPPMGFGRPLPQTPNMMSMGPSPGMPFMPGGGDMFGHTHGNPFPMQMPVPFPTGSRPLPQPKVPKDGAKPAEGE
ncbi:uncharacterized protein LOC62_02G003122 [Vanrija pseudolonga]|uniref:Uncharacterized protein n=1 Tax=Vanrija pseudolonga TaxID=143232 RepID=A0AAF0Y7Z6_9TREE|nr:hypothetical protein LOC62_02G003122 [Vanrija pseudolonga]